MSYPVVGFLADTATERPVAVSSTNPLPVTGTIVVTEGPSGEASAAIAPVATTALATGLVVKAAAGNLYGFNGGSTTVAGFFLIHNSVTVPAAGAVTPLRAYPVAVGQAIDVTFDIPLRFTTGISISFTSAATPFTQTDSATAFISAQAV